MTRLEVAIAKARVQAPKSSEESEEKGDDNNDLSQTSTAAAAADDAEGSSSRPLDGRDAQRLQALLEQLLLLDTTDDPVSMVVDVLEQYQAWKIEKEEAHIADPIYDADYAQTDANAPVFDDVSSPPSQSFFSFFPSKTIIKEWMLITDHTKRRGERSRIGMGQHQVVLLGQAQSPCFGRGHTTYNLCVYRKKKSWKC